MSHVLRDDEGSGDLLVQVSPRKSLRFKKQSSLFGIALTARELGVQASGDIQFALIQDASTVVLFVQRQDFNYAELRFQRSKSGLVPFTPVSEKTFQAWYKRVTRHW